MTKKLIPERKNVPVEHRWDLSPLFKDDEKWETLFVDIEHKIIIISLNMFTRLMPMICCLLNRSCEGLTRNALLEASANPIASMAMLPPSTP